MNRLVLILITFLILAGLTSCTTSEGTSNLTKKEETIQHASAKPFLIQESGQKINENNLEKTARYKIDLTSENTDYRIYFFAENETSWTADETTENHVEQGDRLYKGNYQVALGIKGDKTYYIQDQLEIIEKGYMTWNESAPHTEIIGEDLLVIYQPEKNKIRSALLFTVQNGRVVDLTPKPPSNGLYLSGSLKHIHENIFQTALFDRTEVNPGWRFFTYERTKDAFKLIDQIHYHEETGAYSVDSGVNIHEEWVEEDDFFVSYQNLSLDPSWLKDAARGKLAGVSFSLGTSIQTILEEKPHVTDQGYYEGGPYLNYTTESYFYNETTKKTTILGLPGSRLGLTLEAFVKVVGTPDEMGMDETTEELYAFYRTGENELWVMADPLTDQVLSVRLVGKNS